MVRKLRIARTMVQAELCGLSPVLFRLLSLLHVSSHVNVVAVSKRCGSLRQGGNPAETLAINPLAISSVSCDAMKVYVARCTAYELSISILVYTLILSLPSRSRM